MDRNSIQQFIQTNYYSNYENGNATFTPIPQFMMLGRGRVTLEKVVIEADNLQDALEVFITEFQTTIKNHG